MILDEIIQHKRAEIEESKNKRSLDFLISGIEESGLPRDFLGALRSDGDVKIVAEIKKASPSQGAFRDDFNPTQIAKSYEKGGASALSVLTDRKYFGGSLDYLREIRNHVQIPVLRKDFIVDPYQVYESRYYGADALLLIVAALEDNYLSELLDLTHSVGLDAIVEVHNEDELERALDVGSRIIGINNRDLKTFEVSLDVSARLSKLIPENTIVIGESGIGSSEDIKKFRDEGIFVFLIGETLMRADEPGERLRSMLLDSEV